MVNIKLTKNTVWDAYHRFLSEKTYNCDELPKSAQIISIFNSQNQFLGLGLFSPEQPQALAWFADSQESTTEIISRKIHNAFKAKESLGKPGEPIRIFNSHHDGIEGLHIDRLGNYFFISSLTSAVDELIPDIVRVLQDQKPVGIYLQNISQNRKRHKLVLSETVLFGQIPDALTICESDRSYEYDLKSGKVFAVWLRPLRHWIRVHEAQTERALLLNLAANDLFPKNTTIKITSLGSKEHSLIDTTDLVRKLAPNLTFDMIVAPIPTLATKETETAIFHLWHQLFQHLKPGGLLLFEAHEFLYCLTGLSHYSKKYGQNFQLLDTQSSGSDFPLTAAHIGLSKGYLLLKKA